MHNYLSDKAAKALAFSLISELTFVVLFLVNYSSLIVRSLTSLDSVPVLGSITDGIGANSISGSAQLHMVFQTFFPLVSNAFTTSLVWSLANGAILVAFGLLQYRN